MKNLTILVGNIGSGKSTLTRKYHKDGHVVISRDSLRYGIGAGSYVYNTAYEPTIFKVEKLAFMSFVKLGVDIVIDEIGINKALRKRYITYAKSAGYYITVVEMEKLSMKESVDRRMNDPHGQFDRQLWESIWERFDSLYEAPELTEGIDKIIKITKTGASYERS